MSVRAVILGVLLGLFIAGISYFNDQVIDQTFLVGNHLPIAVFGVVALIALSGVNWLLKLVGRPMRAGELAVMAALALAVCGWPGSGFFRYFTTVTSMPAYLERTEPSWQSSGLLSYAPEGSAAVAPGQVRDWRELASRLVGAGREGTGMSGRLFRSMYPQDQLNFRDAALGRPVNVEVLASGAEPDAAGYLSDYPRKWDGNRGR